MKCTICISPDITGNPYWRSYSSDKPILSRRSNYKIVISRWTLHPHKRKLIERMDVRMADFVYRLDGIVGLEDTFNMQEYSFSIAVSDPAYWDMVEDLVLQAFKEAYGFTELFTKTVPVAPACR